MKTFVRSPYNYDVEERSRETGLLCEDASLAEQSQAEETDINTIVRRFGVTGQVNGVQMPPPITAFVDVTDFRQVQELMLEANKSFMALSAEVRDRFHNNPAEFVAFAENADNIEELRKMGLAVPEKKKETTLADIEAALKENRNGGGQPINDSGNGKEPGPGKK